MENWQIFVFIIVAGIGFAILVLVLESSSLAEQGIRQTLRELWHTFFGKGERK